MNTPKAFVWKRILCLLLAFPLAFGLCACPAGEPATTTATSGGGTTSGKPTSTNPDEVTDAVYANGGEIEGAGAKLAEDAPAYTTREPDANNTVSFATVRQLLMGGLLEEGKTYLHTGEEALSLTGNSKTYDFLGAVLVCPNGLTVKSSEGITVKNLSVFGAVSFEECENVRFEQVEVRHPGTALTLDAASQNISFEKCRIDGKTALLSSADGLVLTDSYLRFTEAGVRESGQEGFVLMNCVLEGEGCAVESSSSEAQIRENTLNLTKESTGITLSGDSLNVLVALNIIREAQASVKLLGTKNTAVVLNSCVTVIAEGNTSVYVCDNALGGRLRAKNNNYFLANNNTYPEDGLDHTTLQVGNQNTNGDGLTDVDARAEVGVNEDLLPHVNRDLFLTMERKATVKVGAKDTRMQAAHYISNTARTGNRVILAPGAYAVDDMAYFNDPSQSNTTVYAYGAYLERIKDHPYNLCAHFGAIRVENITLKGITYGFERQSCGQVYILAKTGNNTFLTVTGAGMDNEFGNTDTSLYNDTWMTGVRAGSFGIFADLSFEFITKRDDGLMEMRVHPSVYEMMNVGDILTCRSKRGAATLDLTECANIVFEDVTVFGASGGFMANETHNKTATTYHRVANTLKNGFVIDEETYNRYLALEEQYGVDLEVSVDENGLFRGSLPHTGSWDATHSVGSGEGSRVISCLFESMSDDATNQTHFHSRMHDIIDNGDGTATIVYKGNYSERMYLSATKFEGYYCVPFEKGHRVYIYTAEGQLVCDTEALSDAVPHTDENGKTLRVLNEVMYRRYIELMGEGSAPESDFLTTCYAVTVKTEDVNFAALEGYDLTSNAPQNAGKVLVDNMSRASNGFYFDNMLMKNIRSRGLLIKASDGVIRNCSFINIGGSCAALLSEINWGESGVSENILIENNYMENTGYLGLSTNTDRYAPISVFGIGGGRLEEDYLLYKNIRIVGNVLRNRYTAFAVYVQAARDLLIEGNDFGTYPDGDTSEHYARGIWLNGAMNVKLENNIYSNIDLAVEEKIRAEAVKNIDGSDVIWEGESLIPDSE